MFTIWESLFLIINQKVGYNYTLYHKILLIRPFYKSPLTYAPKYETQLTAQI